MHTKSKPERFLDTPEFLRNIKFNILEQRFFEIHFYIFKYKSSYQSLLENIFLDIISCEGLVLYTGSN